jgi:Holliday junction resolvasome RuvABC endonuclease subunit
MHKIIKDCAKADHATSLDTRIQFLEDLVGDNADKHSKHAKEIDALKGKHGDLHSLLSGCAKKEHHATMEERLKFLEKELGESADKHDVHKTTMEDRMEFLERKMGDSAEKHWKEIEALKGKTGDIHKAVALCAKADNHASLEERMKFVEKELGESADKHDAHKTTMEDRMVFLEKKIGDSAEKHWKEIEALKKNHGDMGKILAGCAKQEHHASLEERMTFVEKELGESADKHDAHKTTMEDRMEFLEKKIGDSAEKHWKEIEALKKNHGDMSKILAGCAKQEHHASLEKRMDFVEKELGESADKHDKHKTTMEDRMEFLEAKIGDSAEKHAKEIEAVKKNHGDLHKVVSACAKADHASSIEKRLSFLENMVGDNADKHAKALADHKGDLTTHRESMETRLEYLEALVGDSADKHWKEIDAAKKKLGSMELAVSKCARVEHHSAMEKRMDDLEKVLGVTSDDHTQHKNATQGRLDTAERKLKELGISLDGKGHKSDIEKLEGIILAGIDKRLTTIEQKHLQDFAKKMSDYERKHMKDIEEMKSKFGDVDKALKECANIEHYLGLDKKHSDLSRALSESAEAAKARMQDYDGKIDAHKEALSQVKALIDQRFRAFEQKLGENARFQEIMKDVEQRYFMMEEDQKRAREMLESSLQEQIRLEHSSVHSQANQIKEHWEREVKARQAYQENYKELLGQERSAREAIETQLGDRLNSFERSIFAELQRLWQELGKEQTPVIVQQPQAQKIIVREQAPVQQLAPIVIEERLQPMTSYVQEYVSPAPVMGMGTVGSISTPISSYSATSLRAPLVSSSSIQVPQFPRTTTTYTA